MQTQDQQNPGTSWWPAFKRILAPISIIATCLYLVFFAIEFIHWLHEPHPAGPPPHFVVSMRNSVHHEVQEIASVPPSLLANTLITDLSSFDCRWYFACSQRPTKTVYYDFARPCPTCTIQMIPSTQPKVLPRLTYSVGGLPIPTLHTVFGLPHALRITIVKIAHAGAWAILMFVSCTAIYFGLALILAARAKDIHPLVVLIVLTISPAAISLLAALFQWAATETFDGISWALAQVVYVIAWSAALSLAVSLPHVYKAPREIFEAAELIRRV